ncbi:maltose ABC transporter substrate-binding protein [Schaalia sp. 19OD2882]|uniref:sugar ABC transporter substrate-binding protein n=1 Tax=Schaalia sp. 19OD2882 TaxID=2794089 RepID=UPI001C1EB541|nr:maltose ABC transporter substrate-binding protein [Schaalia sp. 19OD2882]QWW19015.1 maltose ABC transporter substrate-binding protein [Schaalia sp. 19OD2882]
MRRGIAAMGAIALTATLAACGGTTTTPASGDAMGSGAMAQSGADANQSAGGTTGELGTLTIWADDTRYPQLLQFAGDFTAATKIGLNVVQKPTADIAKEFITQVPTGNGPDIVVTAHDRLGQLVENGVVATADIAAVKDKFSPASVQGVTYGGQTYGVPYAVESVALVRNNKLTKDTPKTYDEMITSGKAANVERPFVVQAGANGEHDPYHLYAFQTSFGAPVFKQDADGSYTTELGMKGAEGTQFAEWMKAQGAAGVLDLAVTADIAKQLFLDGKTPYIVTGPWNVTAFREAGMDVSVLPIPSAGGKDAQPFVGVQAFFASQKSTNPLLVKQFMDYMSSEAGQQKMFDLGGRVPAMTSVAEKVSDPDLKAFAEVSGKGLPMPAIPAMSAVWKFWGATEGNIVAGKEAPADAWAAMVGNIEKAITK